MKTWHKGRLKEWFDDQYPYLIKGLEFYIKHGYMSFSDKPTFSYAQFRDLCIKLPQYTDVRLVELEIRGIKDAYFDHEWAVHTYAAYHLSASVNLYTKDVRALPQNVALGIVLGCGEPAFQLARATIRRDCAFLLSLSKSQDALIERVNVRPVESFIQMLIANYLDEPLFPEGVFLEDPILVELLKCWRDPDPEKIKAACLAICDYHTYGESFNPDTYIYFPIEILLLFKLRQQLGLENPQLDHPIMNTPLGKLPQETSLQFDDLFSRVRSRMRRDGFDETVVLGDDDWCKLRLEAWNRFYPKMKRTNDIDGAIDAESKALAIAEQSTPHGTRVFNGLRSLAALHNMKGLKTESASFYERALAISRQTPDCDASLIFDDLAALYRDLGRSAEAEALVQARS
jgi:hypothetical protein